MKRIHYNSPVVLTFFLISLAVLALNWFTQGRTNYALFSVYRSSFSIPAVLRLFGHVLGHADFTHFSSNMVLFLVVGPPMEEKYGSRALLSAMALTAVVSGILQCLLFPHAALLGASGVVFMLILLSSQSGMKQGSIPLTLILVASLYLGKEVISILTVRDSISNLTHIVGGLCGTFFGFAVKNAKK